MEDAGAAAITMYSLFEEQIDLEALAQHNFLEQTVFMSAEATAYFPEGRATTTVGRMAIWI